MTGAVLVACEAQTALGDLAQTHAALREGRTALAPLGDFGAPSLQGARLPMTDEPEDDPALRILGRHGRALEPVLRTLHEQADGRMVARERIGLYLAMGMVDAEVHDLAPAVCAARDEHGTFDLTRFFGGAFRSIHPLWPLSMLNNVAAGQFAIDLDLRGDNVVLASQADAGVRAVVEALYALEGGEVDAALVGGAAEALGAYSLARRHLEGRADEPPGEGGGAWFLATDMRAKALGVPPAGRVRGGATTFGAADGGPTADAWRRAIEHALARSGVAPDDIALVVHEAHDEAQAQALAPWSGALWSPRGAIGALGPAAPFVEGALACRHLREEGAGSTILLLAGSASGSAGALVLETA